MFMFLIILFLDLREPIINEESFGVYNNFKHVKLPSDRKIGTYQCVYFMADRNICKNARGSKTLPVICLKNPDLSRNMINLPFDLPLNYFILIQFFIVTFTLWSVATLWAMWYLY